MSAIDWITLTFLLATAVVYFTIGRVIRPLVPPFVAFELASTPAHAKRARMAWQDAKQTRRAYLAMVLEILLIPLYVITASLLASLVADNGHLVVGLLNSMVAAAVAFVGLAHFAENAGLAFTLAIGVRPLVVFVTRVLGKFKYTIMALTVVWVIFETEAYLYVSLRRQQGVNTLVLLIAATLLVGFLAARQLTMLSRERPSLLTLQFAPSRLAAKDVLERWGRKGRKAAERALLLESLLALLYGLMVATLCERVEIAERRFGSMAVYLAWVILTAAACHLAQNLGAYVALRRQAMGWWVGTMRRIGRIRLLLLGAVAAYFICLLISIEYGAILSAGDRIKQLAQLP